MSETDTTTETTEPVIPAVAEPAAPADNATTETPAEIEPSNPATGSDQVPDIDHLKAEVAKWQAMSRKNEARAKDNADKAKRLDEIEEANKTELQKVADRAQRAETALAEAQKLAMRAEKSASTGVPIALIPNGSEEEMEAAVLAFQGALSTALKSRPGTPAAAPAQVVTAAADSTKVRQLTRADLQSMPPQQVLEAQRNGQLDELMGKSS